MKIYLAGDMTEDWVNQIQFALKDQKHTFCVPKALYVNMDKALVDKCYKNFDLLHVDSCDLVICYVSKENPSGYGACCECGRASGKGIPVLTCLELTGEDSFDRNRGFISCVSTFFTNDFDELVDVAKRLVW